VEILAAGGIFEAISYSHGRECRIEFQPLGDQLVRLVVSLAAVPDAEGLFVRPAGEHEKYRRVRGIGKDLEAAETGRFLHQMGTSQEGVAHLLLKAIANPKPGYHRDHDSPRA
jgi:hypothetical protein